MAHVRHKGMDSTHNAGMATPKSSTLTTTPNSVISFKNTFPGLRSRSMSQGARPSSRHQMMQ